MHQNFSIPKDKRISDRFKEKLDKVNPGPGAYEPTSILTKKQITMSQRLKDAFHVESKTPGPGQYNIKVGDINSRTSNQLDYKGSQLSNNTLEGA